MSTGPGVCDVPTGGLARERWGLHAPGGAALTPKWIPEARGQSGPENMLAAPADSERQPAPWAPPGLTGIAQTHSPLVSECLPGWAGPVARQRGWVDRVDGLSLCDGLML